MTEQKLEAGGLASRRVPLPPREDLVDRYFLRPPAPPDRVLAAVLVVVGAVALPWSVYRILAGLPVLGAYLAVALLGLVGLLCLVGGVTKTFLDDRGRRRAQVEAWPRATDAQMDDWLDEALHRAIAVGRRQLDLPPDEPGTPGGGPTVVWFTGLPDVERWEVGSARGADGRVRFSLYPVLVVYLSGSRLSTYECVYSMRGDVFLDELHKEYHLRRTDGLEITGHRVMAPLRLTVHDGHGRAEFATATVTTLQELALVVSGRPAVRLAMSFDLDDRRHYEGSPRSRNDEFVAVLRDWFRLHLAAEPGDRPARGGDPRTPPPVPPPPADAPGPAAERAAAPEEDAGGAVPG